MMTGGNVQFPSGNDYPVTIEDWEYMLPLFQEFFEMAGFPDSAPLIIPPQGYIFFEHFISAFGGFAGYRVRDGVVRAGPLQPEFFEYVSLMRDWFERGWIHQDFATRVGDMFFLPNPPLVFGGAAGAHLGMEMHLGDNLSMPEHGLYFDIRPAPPPIGPGTAPADMFYLSEGFLGHGSANAIYAGAENIGRILNILDIFYTEEGARLRTLGLTAEQIPPGYTIMGEMGLSDGVYWFDEAGNVVFNPNMVQVGGAISTEDTNGIRFPGIQNPSYVQAVRTDQVRHAHDMWAYHDSDAQVFMLPPNLTPTEEEDIILANNNISITDYMDQMLVSFIIGTVELNEATWADFTDTLISLGMLENEAIWQAAYDRALARGR